MGSAPEPLIHRHPPTCGSGSLWHHSLRLRRVKGNILMRKVGSGNQGTACLSSLRYARQSNIPDGPSGASGRTKRREERSVPPRGVSHRSYWSAANPFVLVFTAEQRVSSTAAQSRGCNRSRAITWSVKQTSTKTAALFIQN